MALSKYTGGGYTNYTSYTPTMPLSYYIPPPPPPRYDLDLGHTRMSLWHEGRRRRREEEEEAHSGLVPAGGAALAWDLDRDKRRRRKGHSVKRRELEEGAEQSSQPVEEVSVECGDDATLPCRAPRPDSVDGLEWTRTDLDQYVYLVKDGDPDPTEQHQDYRGRCELKDGTATLQLQNVTSADSGIYECRFVNHNTGVSKRAIIDSDPVSVMRLRVRKTGACAEEEEEKEEPKPIPEGLMRHHYVAVGVVGAYVLVVVFLGVIMAL